MSNKNTGGSAFPLSVKIKDPAPGSPGEIRLNEGMTLRDYFAGQAITEICHTNDIYGMTPTGVAKRAYSIADAMLQEREK